MLVQSGERKVKEYPNPADEEMVEFYLERQQFMDPSKHYSIPVTVNGYEFHAVFGRKNKLPKSVVAVLKNAKSAIHPSPNARFVETALGGQGRPQNELHAQPQELKYVNDFNVVDEREL